MAKKREIEIEIDEKTGEIKIETMAGYQGDECTVALDKFIEVLQGETLEVTDKPTKAKKVILASAEKIKTKK